MPLAPWYELLVSLRTIRVIALSAASLVRSYLSLSVRIYMILATSSAESTLLHTLIRSAAATMLRFLTS